MTFEELKNKVLEQIKGKKWSQYGWCKDDETSFGPISKLVQDQLPNLPKNCFSYHTNNKHMTIYFETYVAHRLIKYPLFDIDIKTKRGEAIYSHWGRTSYDYIVNDLVLTPLTNYNTYADREKPDTATFVDFILDLAKREATKNQAYKDKAISALQAMSQAMGTKDWYELSSMLKYIRDNYSCIYEDGKINQ